MSTWRCLPVTFNEHPTCLAVALLHCPGAHPFWGWWLMSLIHLRPVEGFPPAHVSPGATHELLVQVIDPERCPEPDPAAGERGYPLLTPPDLVHQFAASGDEEARALFAWLGEEVAQQRLSPDSDFRAIWRTRVRIWLVRQDQRSGLS